MIDTLNHRDPGKVVLDLGSSSITGININALVKLRRGLGLEDKVLTMDEPLQLLGRVDEDVRSALGVDVVGISNGYTIGPIEVENTIANHPAVLESAVVGKPDKERGSIVKAYIVLKEGYEPTEELKQDIAMFVKDKLSKHEYPRELEFIDELPKTPDGKIKRKVLKNRNL